MFRRRWSGLPKDVSFPSDLEGLGYFVNEDDEVRSIANPDCYFKFFLNKNARVNERQRFAFNGALEKIIHERLLCQGLEKLELPVGADPDEKHSPIFYTENLCTRKRIVVILGEPTQDLGWLAGRVANGPGGLVKGSVLSFLPILAEQAASPDDESPPGILIANMGQRYWWPEGKRALTISASADIPLPSMVHSGRKFVPELNEIPGSETALQHMTTVFQSVLAVVKATIDVIAIGESCEIAETFFDDQENWKQFGSRLNSMILLGTVYTTDKLQNEAFKKFLEQRTRAYLISSEPLGTPLAGPLGNPSLSIEPLGCPCFSSSEPHFTELISTRVLEHALGHTEDVAFAPGYVNWPIIVDGRLAATRVTDKDWTNVPEDEKPNVKTMDPEVLKKQIQEKRRWDEWARTGEAPKWDSDEEDEYDVEETLVHIEKTDWVSGDPW